MDFDHPGMLLSSLIVGLMGTAIFIYGKKQTDFRCLAMGVTMCVFPYFVSSLIVLWLIAAGCLAGLYAWCRWL